MPAISPVRAANVATHAWTKLHWNCELNFWDLWVPFMHGPTWSDLVNHCPYLICTSCEWPAVISKTQTRIKLPHDLQLQSSLLWVADAALWQSDLHWPSRASRYRSLWDIWIRSFKIYGKWMVQPSKHTRAYAQWSHTSVGLAQAPPNYHNVVFVYGLFVWAWANPTLHCTYACWVACLLVWTANFKWVYSNISQRLNIHMHFSLAEHKCF